MEMVRRCVQAALNAARITDEQAQAMLGGDLNNQIIASSFAARALGVPFIGLYGACSTFVQALVLGSALISGGFLDNAVCVASSHYCTAERQFRFPLELGTQRPPQASWTATACGCALLERPEKPGGLRVTAGTVGRIIDLNISDANHMGAAMAPAVFDCLAAHLADTGRKRRRLRPDRHRRPGLDRAGPAAGAGQRGGAGAAAGEADRLRREPVLPGAGRPRRGQRLRLRGLGGLRLADEAAGGRGHPKAAAHRQRGHVLPHLQPAGAERAGHRLCRLPSRGAEDGHGLAVRQGLCRRRADLRHRPAAHHAHEADQRPHPGAVRHGRRAADGGWGCTSRWWTSPGPGPPCR